MSREEINCRVVVRVVAGGQECRGRFEEPVGRGSEVNGTGDAELVHCGDTDWL